MPSLTDSFFERAVVYIHQHDADGAFGFVVNKPLDVCLEEVLGHLELSECCDTFASLPVYLGGPVAREHGFVLRTANKRAKRAKQLLVSSSKDSLNDCISNPDSANFLLTLGHAGWSPGQLEQEIADNDWLVAPLDASLLFATPIEQRWLAAGRLLGVDLNRLSGHVGHA